MNSEFVTSTGYMRCPDCPENLCNECDAKLKDICQGRTGSYEAFDQVNINPVRVWLCPTCDMLNEFERTFENNGDCINK